MRLDLDFQNDIPEGWTPLEAIAVIKSIDGEGIVRLQQTATEAVSTWEVAGMLLWALDGTRDELREETTDGA
jgi:hypothetical protein